MWRCRELWCRLQAWLGSRVAVAQPLAWEPPYAVGAAQEIATTTTTTTKKKKKKRKSFQEFSSAQTQLLHPQ